MTVLALVALGTGAAAALNHPFGSHPTTYAAGSITPSHVSQATLDQAVRDFYDAWKDALRGADLRQRPLRRRCPAPQAGNLTVSEAHGYGMMIVALMAGHDPEAHAIFDGMFAYFREHPSAIHAHLMSWNQKQLVRRRRRQRQRLGRRSRHRLRAPARRQAMGELRRDRLCRPRRSRCSPPSRSASSTRRGQYVLLGDWVDARRAAVLRRDALVRLHARPPAQLRGRDAATPSGPTSLDHTYAGLRRPCRRAHSPATGLLPDFIADPLGTPAPVAPNFLEGANDGAYDYNACRDPVAPRHRLPRLRRRARQDRGAAHHDLDPQRHRRRSRATSRAGYQLDGTLERRAPTTVDGVRRAARRRRDGRRDEPGLAERHLGSRRRDAARRRRLLREHAQAARDDRHVGQLVDAAGGRRRLHAAEHAALHRRRLRSTRLDDQARRADRRRRQPVAQAQGQRSSSRSAFRRRRPTRTAPSS